MILMSLVLRVLLGGVFTYSGWLKLMSPIEEFRMAVTQYAFLPKPLVMPAVFMVPWLELVFGTFVLLGFMTRKASAVLACFLSAFILLLARSLWLGLAVRECGCFGSALLLAPKQAILLDAALLLSALLVVRRGARSLSLDGWLNR